MSKKRSPGFPTKYLPDYCDMLVTHMADGFSFESFAHIIKVHRDTLYEWTHVHPEFMEAKKRAHDSCLHYWEKVGKDGLYNETIKDDEGCTVTRSINSSIWIFNMKNRFAWRDKQEIALEADHRVSLTEEDIQKKAQELKFLIEQKNK